MVVASARSINLALIQARAQDLILLQIRQEPWLIQVTAQP